MAEMTLPDKELLYYMNKRQTPVTMKSFSEVGMRYRGEEVNEMFISEQALCQISCFLHRELPIRIAKTVKHLLSSPHFVRSANMQKVCNSYANSFRQLRAAPVPSNPEAREQYTILLSSLYDFHSSTLISIAKGLREVRSSLAVDNDSFADTVELQKRIDEFYLSRIGIRMLVEQYLELCKPQNPDMIGLVDLKASPYAIATEAIADAEYMCKRAHGDAPQVIILGRTDLHFPYVPAHLNYMLVELLKNSMRATVELHGIDDMPPIKIVIADGEDNEDVVIKVSDEGGGIRRSNINRVWSYLYTTADPGVLEEMLDSESGDMRDFNTSSPLAGLGYGLPIARNYARYFGGDLTIMSTEGYGTDGYIYLPRLGSSDTSII